MNQYEKQVAKTEVERMEGGKERGRVEGRDGGRKEEEGDRNHVSNSAMGLDTKTPCISTS